MAVYIVRNNETGEEKEFLSLKAAIRHQETLVFTYGIDAELL
jgi:hypothetical protein